MPTPYEFGQHVGKQAFEKAAERGLIADIGLYSNPFTGVPTGLYDTYNSLRNGNYMGALGNVAATGLSFAGGGLIGGGLKGLGRGLIRAGTSVAGKGVANAGARSAIGYGLRGAGHAVANAGRGMNAFVRPATKAVGALENTVARGVQRVVPVHQGATWANAPARTLVNKAVQNPYAAGAFLHTGGNPTGSPQPPLHQ